MWQAPSRITPAWATSVALGLSQNLIFDLSHPGGRSVNDGIPKELCSMTYVSIDDAIRKITRLGPGSLLAKIDTRIVWFLSATDF